MSARWSTQNRDFLIRDLVRDYCVVHSILTEQSTRFAHSGTISYAVLNELLGDAMRKGVLWALKDAAHHLFRTPYAMENCDKKVTSNENCTIANMLDWCVGYVFHECVKLKEDAFQRQHYTNRLLQLNANAGQYKEIVDILMPFTKQTHESIAREMERILGVLANVRDLLVIFLQEHKDNAHVARFFVEEKELVQKSFANHFENLLTSLYGEDAEHHYILAIELALSNGKIEQAQSIIDIAFENDVTQAIILQMEKLLEKTVENAQ